jgi:hypothetical protein
MLSVGMKGTARYVASPSTEPCSGFECRRLNDSGKVELRAWRRWRWIPDDIRGRAVFLPVDAVESCGFATSRHARSTLRRSAAPPGRLDLEISPFA